MPSQLLKPPDAELTGKFKRIIKVSLFIELNIYENIFMFLNILR